MSKLDLSQERKIGLTLEKLINEILTLTDESSKLLHYLDGYRKTFYKLNINS